MQKTFVGLVSALALMTASAPVGAQETVKIGVIMTLSGQFADAGIQMQNGVKPTCSNSATASAARRSS